jgi:hypothetical protein
MNIKLIKFELLTTGIDLRYKSNGKTQVVMADVEQAADLLKKYGFIHDYVSAGSVTEVLIDNPYKRHDSEDDTVWVNYKNYVISLGHNYDERDGENIAYAIETEKENAKIRKQLLRA